MHAFWLAFGITFWAEMGDKTQFIALAYAALYPLRYVFAGISGGVVVMMLVASLAGRLLGTVIPAGYLHAAAALSFFAFAVWTALEKPDEEVPHAKRTRHPVVVVGVSFVLAELGDKTTFTTLALASTEPWLNVWLGATLGMIISDALGALIGRWLGRHIPKTFFKWASASLFFVFGLWGSWQSYLAFRH